MYNDKPAGQNSDELLVELYETGKSWLGRWMFIIVTFLAVSVVFFVSALEGTSEIKASKGTSGKIMTLWRNANGFDENQYPNEYVDTFHYNEKDYYFVIDSYKKIQLVDELGVPVYDIEGKPIYVETSEILKWHWSYDGGLDYVFKDGKFYALSAVVFVVSMLVAVFNYNEGKNKAKKNDRYVGALKTFKESKEKVKQKTHLLPRYCKYKYTQTKQMLIDSVLDSAEVTLDEYKNYNKIKKNLRRWQKRRLNKIRKIKVERLDPSDILQDRDRSILKYKMLAQSEKSHKFNFIIFGGIQRLVNVALTGLVVAFGVVLGNWFLGVSYGLTVLMSAFSGFGIGSDYVLNTLRARIIGKADYLNEFNNLIPMFETEVEKEKEKVVVTPQVELKVTVDKTKNVLNSTQLPVISVQ